MVHAARLLDVPEFTETFLPLMRIAMERDRLHRDLVAKLEQLKASRLRILQAADDERRRLERNLHDGAQQRLTAALLGVRALASSLDGDGDAARRSPSPRSRTSRARSTTSESSPGASTRPSSRARGSRRRFGRAPPARRSPSSSSSTSRNGSRPRSRRPRTTSCAEACTNAVKHARASGVWLSAVYDGADAHGRRP